MSTSCSRVSSVSSSAPASVSSSGVTATHACRPGSLRRPETVRLRSSRGAPKSSVSKSCETAASTTPAAIIAAACASPSEGAVTHGSPSASSSSCASATISGVSREVCCALVRALTRSPAASAASHSACALTLRSRRSSSTRFLSACGLPSKIRQKRSPSAASAESRNSSPDRCDVVLPCASASGIPSRCRIDARNW